MVSNDVVMATEPQVRFIKRLLTEKAIQPEIVRVLETQLALGMSKRQASIFLDSLVKLPARPIEPRPADPAPVSGDHWPTVPEGRFAIHDPADGVLKFYQVDKPQEGRWAGFTFLSVFASDERHSIRAYVTKKALMDVIAADPQEAMQRYGQELGTCGVCGRSLTDETSRAFGIGPVCRGKLGYAVETAEQVEA